MFSLKVEAAVEGDSCKGLVFRGYNSTFHSNGRIERREGVRLLKSKSCPGCKKCEWILDDIGESIACKSLLPFEIEDGKLYSIRVVNVSTDWETGYCDGYDLEIYKRDN